MKTQLLLAVSLLAAFSFNDINAAGGKISGWAKVTKRLVQGCAAFGLLHRLVDLNEKKEIPKESHYKNGFEKMLTMLGVGLFIASFEDKNSEMLESFTRISILAALVTGTHAIANNSMLVKKLRQIPLAGAIFTDAENMHGFEQTSVGALTRSITVYMMLRTALSKATEGSKYDIAPYLLV